MTNSLLCKDDDQFCGLVQVYFFPPLVFSKHKSKDNQKNGMELKCWSIHIYTKVTLKNNKKTDEERVKNSYFIILPADFTLKHLYTGRYILSIHYKSNFIHIYSHTVFFFFLFS